MARISRHAQIILKQEALALDLLKSAETCDSLDMKMDLFERIGKWVAIKNKLEDDGAGGIADYKRRLHAEQSETDQHPAARRPGHGAQANGGARLNAIKSRIPRSDDAGADGDRRGGGGEDAAVAGDAGGVRPGAAGDTQPGALSASGHGNL